jgi:SNF2 family DNA or RNA helicase
MLEEQAMSRVHRLGQTKPVRLMRLLMRNTWEEKIMEVQKRKKTLADLIVDGARLKEGDAGRKQLLVYWPLSNQCMANVLCLAST